MIKLEEVYKIGKLGKAHGIHGEVSFQFTDDVFDRAEADYLILEADGILVPFFMEEYRFRSDAVALVKFCDVDTQERARELTGCEVYFPLALMPDDEEPTWASLEGFDLIEARTGTAVGRVAAVDDQTLNVLFQLEDGRLIPASGELVKDIDTDHKKIFMELPEGILDL